MMRKTDSGKKTADQGKDKSKRSEKPAHVNTSLSYVLIIRQEGTKCKKRELRIR